MLGHRIHVGPAGLLMAVLPDGASGGIGRLRSVAAMECVVGGVLSPLGRRREIGLGAIAGESCRRECVFVCCAL
jgi:hypothetical protein